jgi:hypothetical protein
VSDEWGGNQGDVPSTATATESAEPVPAGESGPVDYGEPDPVNAGVGAGDSSGLSAGQQVESGAPAGQQAGQEPAVGGGVSVPEGYGTATEVADQPVGADALRQGEPGEHGPVDADHAPDSADIPASADSADRGAEDIGAIGSAGEAGETGPAYIKQTQESYLSAADPSSVRTPSGDAETPGDAADTQLPGPAAETEPSSQAQDRKVWESPGENADFPASMQDDLGKLGQDLRTDVDLNAWTDASRDDRMAVLADANNRIRETYGLSAKEVNYSSQLPEGVTGQFEPATGEVTLSSSLLDESSPDEAVKTLAHENFHDYQQQAIDGTVTDPYAESRGDAWSSGQDNYDSEDFTAYMANPLEADAFAAEKAVFSGYRRR